MDLLAQQIRECGALNNVEINVSDNGSPDDTDIIVKDFIANNQDIKVGYNHFDNNYGPDKNYIYTMQMAHGEYTLLLGDDDFLKEEGLSLILKLIKEYPEADVFLSNRTEIDEQGNFLKECVYLNNSVPSRFFDFGDDNQAGLYFSLCSSVGGCLTFISSIIYKTSILEEFGEYDGCLDGTFYSFWFYLWGKLSRGGKLYYLNCSYILNTQANNNKNFGNGLKRLMVEFEGFSVAANMFFSDKIYKSIFLSIPSRCLSISTVSLLGLINKETYKTKLLPLLKKNEELYYLNELEVLKSARYHLSCLEKIMMPQWLVRFLNTITKG